MPQICQRLRNRGKIRRKDDDSKVCIPVTVFFGYNAMVLALNAMGIRSAEMLWVSVAQREVYSDVIDVLQSARELPQSAPLQKLCPQLDSTSGAPVLCVGGRLRAAHHLAGVSSPIILPPKHRITELIFRQEDDKCNHGVGTNHLLSNLVDKYWIVRGKQVVKVYRHSCIKCQKIWRKAAWDELCQYSRAEMESYECAR